MCKTCTLQLKSFWRRIITITDDNDIKSCDPDYDVHSVFKKNKNNFYTCRVFLKTLKIFLKTAEEETFLFACVLQTLLSLRSWNISVFSSPPRGFIFLLSFVCVVFVVFPFIFNPANPRWRLAACPVLGHTVWFWNVTHISHAQRNTQLLNA